MADKVKKCKVVFNVNACPCHNKIYVCGNLAELGEWNAAKAVELKYDEEAKCYTCSKMLPEGANVEYKVLASKDWANVECGAYQCELANHVFVVAKGHVEVATVENFK